MNGLAPRIVLGKSWWDKTRKEAYASTGFCCLACGTSKRSVKGGRKVLEAHERYRINYSAGTMTYIETVPLCPYCHAYIHAGRLQMLLDNQQITHERFVSIIQHGGSILAQSGIKKPKRFKKSIAHYSKWCLVIDGKRYYPNNDKRILHRYRNNRRRS